MVIKKGTVVSFFIASAAIGVAISYSKLYLFHIALLGLLIYSSISIFQKKGVIVKEITPTKLHYFFYFMFFWYACTLFWSIDKGYSLEYLFYIFCGASVSLVITFYSSNFEKQNKIFKVLAIVFAVEMVLCLLEIFTPFRLPISPYSNYLSYFGRNVVSEDLANIPLNSTLPTGFRWNPNNLATTMTLIFPFVLLYPKRMIKIFGTISLIIIILATDSRGNILVMSLILFLYTYCLKPKRALIYGMLIPAIGIFFILVFSSYFSSSDNNIVRTIESSFTALKMYVTPTENFSQDSIGIRQALIDQGMQGLKDTYGIGVGGGATKALGEGVYGIQSMHNFWIEMLVEAGLVFFVIFIWWYLTVMWRLYKITKTKNIKLKYYATATLLSMCGFIFGAVSPSTTIYLLPMWIIFGFAIAIINNNKRLKNESNVFSQ